MQSLTLSNIVLILVYPLILSCSSEYRYYDISSNPDLYTQNTDIRTIRSEDGSVIRSETADGKLYSGEVDIYSAKKQGKTAVWGYEDGDMIYMTNFIMEEDGSYGESTWYINQGSKLETYYADRTLKEERIDPNLSEDNRGFWKQWYPNGKLRFEIYWNADQEYDGLMTTYSENGDVQKQELYADGKLIEVVED